MKKFGFVLILALVFTMSTLLIACDNKETGNDKDNDGNVLKEVKIEYYSGDELTAEEKGNGNVEVTLDKKYSNGDKIKVVLPEGEKYIFFNMDSGLKEALIYVPSGVYEYNVSNSVLQNMPPTIAPNKPETVANPTVKVRIPTQEELSETRNVALNPYDTQNNANSFPHASAGNTYNNGNSPEFNPRCAIDGFTNNLGHGGYPVQSWGPDSNVPNDKLWFAIDFGREVEVSSINIIIRADFPHDTYLKGAVLEFSDGTTKDVALERTSDPQTIEIDNIKTSSLKIKDFDKAVNTWVAFTEIEVLGR